MIHYWNRKIKSGALQFTVFIGVLIALLLSGLILYAYTFFYTKEQSKGAVENILLTNSTFNILLQDSKPATDTLELSQFSSNNQKIKYNISQWGLFEKALVITQHRKKRFVKTALMGGYVDTNQSPTLYLQENNNPLSVVGNAEIKGVAHLPSQGIKPGYISGQSYYGSQLIYGQIKKSALKLPELSEKYFERIMLYNKNNDYGLPRDATGIGAPAMVNSFKNKTICYYSTKEIILQDNSIVGNIIIKSDSLIRIRKSSVLKDVIIVAPVVEIEDETGGNFQVIATEMIRVGKKCRLSYPSALVLLGEGHGLHNSVSAKNILIHEQTQIDGYVCYFNVNEQQATDFKPQLILMEEASIRGQVYCMGNFELKGNVEGSVFVKQFIVNAGGSVYLNHLFNGKIRGFGQLEYFGGLLFKENPKTVLKWGY